MKLSRIGVFRHFCFIEFHARPRKSFYRRFLLALAGATRRNKLNERAGYPSRSSAPPFVRVSESRIRELFTKFFRENEERILTCTGSDLELMADHFGIDENLPVQQKQEAVYQKFADVASRNRVWTREEVARQKEAFLRQLEVAHFPNLVCNTLGIKESIYKGWLRSDLEFSEAVRHTQQRFAERIALNLMQKAEEGDLGAQMYALKQFGDAVKYMDPATMGQEVAADMDVTLLSPKEQEELLRLMNKARTGIDHESTKFLEDEDVVDASGNVVEHEVVRGLLHKGDEPRVFEEELDDEENVIDVTPEETIEVIQEEGD